MEIYVYNKATRILQYFILIFSPTLGIFLGIINIRYALVLSIIVFIQVAILTPFIIRYIRVGIIASKIRIDETGLTLTNKKVRLHMAWKHVIWAGYYVNGFIVFSRKADPYILKAMLRWMSDSLMFFQLQPGVLEEIKKYWDKEIITKPPRRPRIKWFN